RRRAEQAVRDQPRRRRAERESPRTVAGRDDQALDAVDRSEQRPAVGRAQARRPTGTAAPAAGRKRAPRSRSAGSSAAGSGSRSPNVDPSADTPPAVTREKI